MSEMAILAGVGMTRFHKPGQSPSWEDMGVEAATAALSDAGLDYGKVGQVYAGYVYAGSTAGQSVAYRLGLTGIPVINVNNNCATGATALYLARQAVEAGATDVALAVGFEEMNRGALVPAFPDKRPTMGMLRAKMHEIQGDHPDVPSAAQFFGGAARDYRARYGTRPETFAAITVKSRRHARHNPNALFTAPLSVDEVLASPMVFDPLTRFQCCPPTCGGAAAVVVSESFYRQHGLSGGVRVLAQAMTSDEEAAFEGASMMNVVGAGASRAAAREVYESAGLGPADLDAVELHDCFTANEIITYEALRLCGAGQAEQYINDGRNTYGGDHVVNPSGGLLAKGHPLGATGLAQCAELTWQIRGTCGPRQVEGARTGLAHNIGLGSACVVTLLGAM